MSAASAVVDPFSPLNVGPVRIKNRFIRAGANEMMTRATLPQKALLEHHRQLAEGGIGMTTLAYLSVSADGRTMAEQGILNPASVPHYKAVTDAIHAAGALANAQITHAGSFVMHRELSTWRAISASGGIDQIGLMLGRPLQREMNRDDMDRITAEFVAAARCAVEAGFDAIELHMGHGYLLNQFISPLSNKRRDGYGGNAEQRMRFPVEVLSAVKQAVGDQVAILAKINLVDGVPKGASAADAVVTAQALERAGVDMLVLSGGRNIEASWQIFGSPMPYEDLAAMQPGWLAKLQFKLLKATTPKSLQFKELFFLDAARLVRAATQVKLAYIGGVQSLAAAQTALAEGFDAVVMARATIHDPAIVNKWRIDGNLRSGCTACNRCVAAMYGPSGTHCPVVGNAFDPAWKLQDAGAA